MNATVARIVEIMFQDTVMNDEVQALKDEVMNNCQERYVDMLQRGMNEDEAIAAVVDSLKGMEEVVAQYPRKQSAAQTGGLYVDQDGEAEYAYPAYQVKKVQVLLAGDDVKFEASSDDMVHVYYDQEEIKNLKVELKNALLRIERDKHMETKSQPAAETQTAGVDENVSWDSLSGLLRGVGKLLSNISVNINIGGGGEVTIAIPAAHPIVLDVHTTSGDVEVNGISPSELCVETTSGDLTVDQLQGARPALIRMKGASGDVDITGDTAQLSIQTVSGDVEYTGNCPDVNVHTVSGDAEVTGVMHDVRLKTVSGDVDVCVEGSGLHEVSCKTTSGDLTVKLPAELRGQVAVQLNSVSGSLHNRVGEPFGAPAAYVSMQSVSGDVTLC